MCASPPTDNSDSSDPSDEDDGILLFTLLSPATLTSVHLVLLDAKSFEEVARIAFRAQGTVTEGFHGVFVPDGGDFVGY
jgi:carotenoid cleavage dioxygenase-like enzyme